jgi:hypothetical protein
MHPLVCRRSVVAEILVVSERRGADSSVVVFTSASWWSAADEDVWVGKLDRDLSLGQQPFVVRSPSEAGCPA